MCVSALVTDACFLCLLICLEPKRYCALSTKLCFYEPMNLRLTELVFHSLDFCLGLQFGKLQNVQTGCSAGSTHFFFLYCVIFDCCLSSHLWYFIFLCSFWKLTQWKEVLSCWRSGRNSWPVMIWESNRYFGTRLPLGGDMYSPLTNQSAQRWLNTWQPLCVMISNTVFIRHITTWRDELKQNIYWCYYGKIVYVHIISMKCTFKYW